MQWNSGDSTPYCTVQLLGSTSLLARSLLVRTLNSENGVMKNGQMFSKAISSVVVLSAIVAIGLAWSSMTNRNARADKKDSVDRANAQDSDARAASVTVEYKAILRKDINTLDTRKPVHRHDDPDPLTYGLNVLAADGWRLVTIEPFSAQSNGLNSTSYYRITYIFARTRSR